MTDSELPYTQRTPCQLFCVFTALPRLNPTYKKEERVARLNIEANTTADLFRNVAWQKWGVSGFFKP